GRLVDIGDTRLNVVERGRGYPLILLHGGPGLDHHEFADYLDPLADTHRLLLVDQRAQGRSAPADPATWTLQRMAADVVALARALDLTDYAVLGHSFGAFVTLQWAVDFPDEPGPAIVSSGLPSSRYLAQVEENLETFEPVELRERVTASWEREQSVRTPEDVAALLHDQLPFHFRDPLDPRIEEFERRSAGARYSPDVLRHFAKAGYGDIDLEPQLAAVRRPVLVLAGRHDRTCVVEGARVMAEGIPNGELVVFEQSAHMSYVEETDLYLDEVGSFLARGR
ncbi:MAG TPA: alpha/beta fold hydrolase, partial [Candidatus Dormibacteraeota bacterium]|nr:alpha/beta fold hydrolase [Candidatus Dormibacteraeota bacterium]